MMRRMTTLTKAIPDSRLRRIAPFLLIFIALLILLPANNLLPLIDRDEPRFAQATREMIDRDEWVVPYFNEEYRFDKPILIYWMMRTSYAVFGENEFGARLPSVLSTILLALIVFKMGARWFSVKTGFFAAFALLTCVQILMHGRSAVADMPMVAMVALAQFALFELLHNRDEKYPWSWFWTFYLALGIGFLAKGPVTFAVPILTIPIYRFILWRKPLRFKNLRLLTGIPVVLLIVGAWGIPALIKTGGEFWKVGMVSHVWDRGFETFQGHGAFFFYYLVTALLSLFPWSAFIGDGITAAKMNRSAKNAFLISWLIGTYTLFSFYRTKLPHYVMPAFPAFFLILGQITNPDYHSPRWARRWFWSVIGLMTVIIGIAVTAALAIPFNESLFGLRTALLGGAGIFTSLTLLAICWRQEKIRLLILPLVGVAVSVIFLGSGLRSVNPAVQLQSQLTQMPENTVFGFNKFKEPSLVFYTNHRWETPSTEELNTFLGKPGPRVLLILDKEIRIEDALLMLLPGRKGEIKIHDFSGRLKGVNTDGYEEIDVEGINIARTCYVNVKVFLRR